MPPLPRWDYCTDLILFSFLNRCSPLHDTGRRYVLAVVSFVAAEASIAVLPFADMSPQKDQEYFCDGMGEEILNALTKVENLRVASRTSAFQFKNKAEVIRNIGTQLNVRTVVEGSVRKASNKIRIIAKLLRF